MTAPSVVDGLRILRGELLARLGDAQRELAALLEETGADDDEHDPDGSPVSLQRTLAAAIVQRAETDLAAVDDALRRVAEGTYGMCERCGRAIPAARLEALPAAPTCVSCAGDGRRGGLARS
jgi:DnaK suppressor protein